MKKRTAQLFELIEGYLDGNLDPEVLAKFESDLAEDVELRAEVHKHRELREAFNTSDASDFRRKVAEIGKQYEDVQIDQESMPKRLWNPMRIAAALIVLVGLATFFWLQRPTSTERLYREYYEAYPVADATRGTAHEGYTEAMARYGANDFEGAAPLLETLVETAPDDGRLKLYLGNCYLNLDRIEAAGSAFEPLLTSEVYAEQAQWYLVFVSLKSENVEEAATLLRSLIDFDGIYADKAKALLNELKETPPSDTSPD